MEFLKGLDFVTTIRMGKAKMDWTCTAEGRGSRKLLGVTIKEEKN